VNCVTSVCFVNLVHSGYSHFQISARVRRLTDDSAGFGKPFLEDAGKWRFHFFSRAN
jgi:hypothetical protein